MAQKTIDVPTTPTPRKLSYQFVSFTGLDWAVIVAGFILTYATMQVVWRPLAIIGFFSLMIFMLWPLKNGRRYYVQLMNLYAFLWLDVILEHEEWAAQPRRLVWWKRTVVRCFIEPEPFPYSIDKLYDIGLLFLRSNRSDTIVVKGDGSSFQRETPVRQAEMLDRLSEAIKDLRSYKRLNAQIGLVVRRRPCDQTEVDTQNIHHLLAGTMLPEILVRLHERGLAATRDSVLEVASTDPAIRKQELADFNCHQVMVEARAAAATYGLAHEMYATLTIRRSRRLQLATRRRRSKPLDPKDARAEVIVKLAEDFREQLEDMGVQNPTILDQYELQDFVREGRDVVDLDAYRKARSLDADGRDTSELWRPQSYVKTWDKTSEIDRSHHMTFRFVGLPGEEPGITPAQMSGLFDSVVTRSYLTRSLTSQVVKGNAEYNLLTGAGNLVESLMDFGSVFRTGDKTEKRRQGLRNLTTKLADQEHITYFGLWYTLSSADPDDFERDTALLRRAAAKVNCKIEMIEGTAWTRRATQSSLYGVAQM